MNTIELNTRKALLLAEAERERMALAAAWQDVRTIVSPPVDPVRRARGAGSFTTTVLRTALPMLGFTRFGKLVRIASMGLTAYRAIRGCR